MAKEKTHTFTINVTFDKACTAAVARREVKDCIHGDFYTSQIEEDEPEKFRVGRIGRTGSVSAA